jgi:GDP-L-fucose synthase
MVDVMSRAYRQQYGCNFITAIPNNLYGENDNYDLANSHVIPALTRKIWEAKINRKSSVECWGDGSPLREFTYSQDIARILIFLLKNYDGAGPINIGNTVEYSIKDVVRILCEVLEYDGKIVWNTEKPGGQHRKPSSNLKLLDLGWKKENYTPLKAGLIKTCKWFKMNYPHIRGVE